MSKEGVKKDLDRDLELFSLRKNLYDEVNSYDVGVKKQTKKQNKYK